MCIRNFLFMAQFFLLSACATPELFVEEARYFDEQVKDHPALISDTLSIGDFQLHYAQVGDSGKPAVLFIHGAPGNWRNAARYLMDERLQKQAQLIAIDRPGWGNSRLESNRVELSFSEQGRLIQHLLAKINRDNGGQGVILVGHSLGASIAPAIAIGYPDLVSGLVLISGSIDPELGRPRWYNRAATIGLVSWFLDPQMRKANREIMPLSGELEAISERLQELTQPIILIQGMQDKLVSPENADYAEKMFLNAPLQVIRLADAGHFVPWENRETVARSIMELLSAR